MGKREYRKTIKLDGSRGQQITVCVCCANLVDSYKWHVLSNGYAARSTWKPRKMIYIHRVIAGAPKGKIVDHINGDTLYNTCWNLRVGTQRQNTANAGMWRHNTSGYKGVTWNKELGKWKALINVNGKQIYLGSYNNLQDAAIARRIAAKKYWGDFARELQYAKIPK